MKTIMSEQRWLAVAIIAAAATIFGAGVAAASVPIPTAIVETESGRVQGLVETGIASFKGIRYGAPPIGDARFMPPRPPEPWDGVLDATDYGAPAMQMPTGVSASTTTDIGRQLSTIFTTQSDMKIDNEDCLFLNVWTPATDDGKRPVMVWLHGGGYAYGSGAWPVYDGHDLARQGDVVVVTVNHRLNVFGYLYLADIGGERYAASGNAGMLDLVLALEWVRDNIARFGGDPGNVTIMGESGGGSKVSTLMAMPAAKGLFHKAIIQSGPGLRGVPAAQATKSARAVLAELDIGAENLAEINDLPAPVILDAAYAAAEKAGGGFQGLRLAPVVDGGVLPRHPFTPDAPAQAKDIPVLIGWNKDEMTIFNTTAPWFGTLTEEALPARAEAVVGDKARALLPVYRSVYPDYTPTYLFNAMLGDRFMFLGSVTLAERKAAQGGAPVYMYRLVWETPVADGLFKTPHTLDIPFMFANVDKALALTGDSEAAHALERQMSSAWIAFARHGDPNNDALPEWPAYDAERRATMIFDVEPEVVNDPIGEIRTILQQTE